MEVTLKVSIYPIISSFNLYGPYYNGLHRINYPHLGLPEIAHALAHLKFIKFKIKFFRCRDFPFDKRQCDDCETNFFDCVENCDNEASCISNCNREYSECISNCSA